MDYPNSKDLHQGKFTDGDPIAGISPSLDSADHMNAVYDEVISTIRAGNVSEDVDVFSQLALSIRNQLRSSSIFTATGNENHIILTSVSEKLPVDMLRDGDKIQFYMAQTNTEKVITVSIDQLTPVSIANITAANQLLKGALATLLYTNNQFWLTQQINPKTGHEVSDIGKLIVDSMDILSVGEIAFDGAELVRAEQPIFWAKIQATSNLIEQADRDANPEAYAGYYGTGDGSTTFTIPMLGGEFIRMVDNGREVDAERRFGSWQRGSVTFHDDGNDVGHVSQGNIVNESYDKYEDEDTPSHTLATSEQKNYYANKKSYFKIIRPRNIAYFAKTRV